MQLLRKQIDKEEKWLVQDKDELEALEAAAKSSGILQERHSRNHHPLLTTLDHGDIGAAEVAMQRNFSASISMLGLEVLPQTQPLIQQLRGHLESMGRNITRISPAAQALGEAKATLDMFVASKTDME